MGNTGTASLTINELREFASFSACEQRYIKRSLDVGLGRQDAFKLWARDACEVASIRSQYVAYQDLKALRPLRRLEQAEWRAAALERPAHLKENRAVDWVWQSGTMWCRFRSQNRGGQNESN